MAAVSDDELRLCIAVTGHRDLVDRELGAIEARVECFFQQLASEYPDLPLELLSPLAAGGDQLVARVALRMRIPLVAVLPMELSEYEKDFSEPGSLEEFRATLLQAERVICMPPAPGNGPAPYEGRARQTQYAQVGTFLSKHCQVLLALWDGKEGQLLGGTGQVVRFHLTDVMPGFDVDSSPASLLADNENDLVYHVVCSRDRPDGAPAGGLKALDAAWFSSRDDGARTAELPGQYREMLDRLQQFARDWKEKQDIVNRNSSGLLEDVPDLSLPSGCRLADRFFQAADGLAIHYQRRVHWGLRTIHILAILMGLEFIVYAEYDGPGYMVLIFLALFFTGVIINVVGERREWHRKYLDYRALAEGLRVQLYWNLAGVVESGSVEFAYDNFLQQQDVDLGWVRHVMRRASLYRQRGEKPDPAWVPWVIADWVGEPGSERGQLGYYARKTVQNAARYRRTSRTGRLSLWTGIALAFLLLMLGGEANAGARQLLLILMGVLPLIAGIWDAYSHKRAEKELIKQYSFMSRVFSKARKLLNGSTEVGFQRRVLRALGQAALDEGAEWLLMHRERPLEHGRL